MERVTRFLNNYLCILLRNFVVVHILYYRINEKYWKPGNPIVDKVDAHLKNSGHASKRALKAWKKLLPLLRAIHGNISENFKWSMDYYRHFIKVLNDKSPKSAIAKKLKNLLHSYKG